MMTPKYLLLSSLEICQLTSSYRFYGTFFEVYKKNTVACLVNITADSVDSKVE